MTKNGAGAEALRLHRGAKLVLRTRWLTWHAEAQGSAEEGLRLGSREDACNHVECKLFRAQEARASSHALIRTSSSQTAPTAAQSLALPTSTAIAKPVPGQVLAAHKGPHGVAAAAWQQRRCTRLHYLFQEGSWSTSKSIKFLSRVVSGHKRTTPRPHSYHQRLACPSSSDHTHPRVHVCVGCTGGRWTPPPTVLYEAHTAPGNLERGAESQKRASTRNSEKQSTRLAPPKRQPYVV
ncbi:hypothetical protein CC78DRAFT_573890 [Lojkania enalia]|uniref:Uncharacterized protein n=1 Tax=Lojkania enalia TaxID=147567 RepID=A0A9P4NC90_9PLEO|nr:hypothetical protein CC78DRAFT_573890 [Didymosphaeria enalia]